MASSCSPPPKRPCYSAGVYCARRTVGLVGLRENPSLESKTNAQSCANPSDDYLSHKFRIGIAPLSIWNLQVPNGLLAIPGERWLLFPNNACMI